MAAWRDATAAVLGVDRRSAPTPGQPVASSARTASGIALTTSGPQELPVPQACSCAQIDRACPDPMGGAGPSRRLGDDLDNFVVATATTRPVKLGQPFTRWSLRKLVAQLRKVARPDHPHRTRGITLPAPPDQGGLGPLPGPGLHVRRVRPDRDPAHRRQLPGWACQSERLPATYSGGNHRRKSAGSTGKPQGTDHMRLPRRRNARGGASAGRASAWRHPSVKRDGQRHTSKRGLIRGTACSRRRQP
jgi:hypothetical protein